MLLLPYYVQSECPRGERRVYWVVKRGASSKYDETVPASDRNTERAAQALCDRLNAVEDLPRATAMVSSDAECRPVKLRGDPRFTHTAIRSMPQVGNCRPDLKQRISLRETVHFYIDRHGIKYRKTNGTSTETRWWKSSINLSTLEPIA